MKRLLTFLTFAFAIPSFAQKTDTTIFNGVTKIIIVNKLTAHENYKMVGESFLDHNYNIGAKDSEFFQISSEPIKVTATGAAHMLSIYAVCKDNQITLTGKTKNLSNFKMVSWQENDSPVQIIPYKKLRDLTKNIYNKLSVLAKSLKHDAIIYSE